MPDALFDFDRGGFQIYVLPRQPEDLGNSGTGRDAVTALRRRVLRVIQYAPSSRQSSRRKGIDAANSEYCEYC
jgi:hypothetical protein